VDNSVCIPLEIAVRRNYELDVFGVRVSRRCLESRVVISRDPALDARSRREAGRDSLDLYSVSRVLSDEGQTIERRLSRLRYEQDVLAASYEQKEVRIVITSDPALDRRAILEASEDIEVSTSRQVDLSRKSTIDLVSPNSSERSTVIINPDPEEDPEEESSVLAVLQEAYSKSELTRNWVDKHQHQFKVSLFFFFRVSSTRFRHRGFNIKVYNACYELSQHLITTTASITRRYI